MSDLVERLHGLCRENTRWPEGTCSDAGVEPQQRCTECKAADRIAELEAELHARARRCVG